MGVFWLQQARDEFLLNKIARHLFDSVGKSISSESFKVVVIAIIDLISWPMLNYSSNNNNNLGIFFPYCLSIQQWEGLIELLGSESKPAGSLEFLHKYNFSLIQQ